MQTLSALLPHTEVRSVVLVVSLYLVLSLFAFVTYGVDKAAAKRGGRRVPEARLHLIALAGGWPGALAARHLFRHKTKKQPFRAVFWGTVAANCLAFSWVLLRFWR